ncbi:hypothetical protein CLAFUW4_13775 [Fulvia fulva]|uniref:Uncharacterized protein n=1 Tax=Passalora fulva TaxID=5499 RepID=A0A9Q8PKZ0_PASFU|nr:uncharacterized protein CLAFUR5_13621 [Fulvia fulva]KAK4610363.1 hypothetical protein CLAFUR4_13778 [Fulvia fulva]KAK4611326.1 hypothetical protein CLAFUR0_13782 [Fulvia fulva]UJO24304.1 hypothetical protein CLAFUR5_13621 [Fulvia fulva]WPV22110.1 hypothetical protein CLAFUW4_13775 [Fulvia fulva]WPV37358.1 hypothetical protein CLAFUW7_13783 [Fulvia fulva]
MRNRIYRAALVKDQPIRTSPYTFNSPGLLKACRTTRSEATAIYLLENTFEIDARKHDSHPLLTFNTAVTRLGFLPQAIKMNLDYRGMFADWMDLVAWVRRLHARKIHLKPPPGVVIRFGRGQRGILIDDLGPLIEGLREVSWPKVAAILRVIEMRVLYDHDVTTSQAVEEGLDALEDVLESEREANGVRAFIEV